MKVKGYSYRHGGKTVRVKGHSRKGSSSRRRRRDYRPGRLPCKRPRPNSY